MKNVLIALGLTLCLIGTADARQCLRDDKGQPIPNNVNAQCQTTTKSTWMTKTVKDSTELLKTVTNSEFRALQVVPNGRGYILIYAVENVTYNECVDMLGQCDPK